jgi:hypothetical protein
MVRTGSIELKKQESPYNILQEGIPLFTVLYIDDVAIKGPITCYENSDSTYETIPKNSGICRFIWEQLTNINRILKWLKYVSSTFSGKKLKLCIPTIVILWQ